jgi:hypothetical protein
MILRGSLGRAQVAEINYKATILLMKLRSSVYFCLEISHLIYILVEIHSLSIQLLSLFQTVHFAIVTCN